MPDSRAKCWEGPKYQGLARVSTEVPCQRQHSVCGWRMRRSVADLPVLVRGREPAEFTQHGHTADSGRVIPQPHLPESVRGTARSIFRCSRRTSTWNGASCGSPARAASIARLAASVSAAVTT